MFWKVALHYRQQLCTAFTAKNYETITLMLMWVIYNVKQQQKWFFECKYYFPTKRKKNFLATLLCFWKWLLKHLQRETKCKPYWNCENKVSLTGCIKALWQNPLIDPKRIHSCFWFSFRFALGQIVSCLQILKFCCEKHVFKLAVAWR